MLLWFETSEIAFKFLLLFVPDTMLDLWSLIYYGTFISWTFSLGFDVVSYLAVIEMEKLIVAYKILCSVFKNCSHKGLVVYFFENLQRGKTKFCTFAYLCMP